MARPLAALLFAAALASAQDLVLVRDGRASAAIVLEAEATEAEERSARELRDHLKEMSGADVEILRRVPADGRVAVRIRHDRELAEEEFRLKSEPGDLVISGGRPRGALYGCYALLDRLGVRWYTATVTHVPRKKTVTLPPLDERGAPAFEERHVFITEADDPDWAARNRLNGASKKMDAEHGGCYLRHPFVHTFEQIVPAELFGTHEDLFPLLDGRRSAGASKGGKIYSEAVQRCLSSLEVEKLAIDRVSEWIREVPDARLISVSQNDGDGWCECRKCRATEAKFGGKSGLLLWFVNQVAKAHPDRGIDTIAYGQTLAPPTGIAPRANVRVRLCPIDVCHAHPYAACDAKATREFLEHLKGWDALTDAVAVWHYGVNVHTLLPFPDFSEFPADLRLYRASGARGIFFQGAHPPGGGGSDAEMRAWVLARLLWNPDENADALVTEWMKGVYGAAWEPMRAWFDRVHAEAAKPGRHLFLQDSPMHEIFSEETLAAGEALFEKASKLARDKAAAAAVAKARLGLRYARLERAKIPGADLDSFIADLRRLGIQSVAEGRTLDDWEAEMRKRRGK